MKVKLIAKNNYKNDTAEDRETELTKIVEKRINRKAEQDLIRKSN